MYPCGFLAVICPGLAGFKRLLLGIPFCDGQGTVRAKQSGHVGPCPSLAVLVSRGSHCPSLSLSVLIYTMGRILPSSPYGEVALRVSYVSSDVVGSLVGGGNREIPGRCPVCRSILGAEGAWEAHLLPPKARLSRTWPPHRGFREFT